MKKRKKKCNMALTQIKKTKSKGSQGVLITNEKTLQELYKNSGKHAIDNEFQAHYWALLLRHTGADGTFLDIAFPTVYFNYPQEVSYASISFDMKDVQSVSEKLEKVHNVQVTKLLKDKKLIKAVETIFNCEFEPLSVNLGTVHRHPGRGNNESFSGTDLDTNPESHGIVFPFKQANNTPSFSSIVTINKKVCKQSHSEYRVVNGKLNKDITYEEGRSCSIVVKDKENKMSEVEKVLTMGKERNTVVYTKDKNSLINDYCAEQLALVYENLISPMTQFVLPHNLKVKTIPKSHILNGNMYMSLGCETIENTILPYDLEYNPTRTVFTQTKAELVNELKAIDAFFKHKRPRTQYRQLTKEQLKQEIEICEAALEVRCLDL